MCAFLASRKDLLLDISATVYALWVTMDAMIYSVFWFQFTQLFCCEIYCGRNQPTDFLWQKTRLSKRHFLNFLLWPIYRINLVDRAVFIFECRKTKAKVISLANHNSRKQSNEPIRPRSKYMSPCQARKTRASNHDWFWFYFWLVEEVARDFLTNHKA